jgi:hypothetical protein
MGKIRPEASTSPFLKNPLEGLLGDSVYSDLITRIMRSSLTSY